MKVMQVLQRKFNSIVLMVSYIPVAAFLMLLFTTLNILMTPFAILFSSLRKFYLLFFERSDVACKEAFKYPLIAIFFSFWSIIADLINFMRSIFRLRWKEINPQSEVLPTEAEFRVLRELVLRN